MVIRCPLRCWPDLSTGCFRARPQILTYTPNLGFVGDDSFTFEANDAQSSSPSATVSVTVTRTNHQPAADAQSVVTAEDTTLAIVLTGSDPDSDPLSFVVTAAPAHGALSGTAPNLTYTPAANYNGPDSFQFVANDGLVDSLAATVSIDVAPVNDSPLANAQSVTVAEDSTVAVTLAGSDVDGDILSFSLVDAPAHGVLSGTAPNLTYTPAANYNGPDGFTFLVNDGTVDSASAAVSLTVTAVNDAPLANPQSIATNEDTAKAVTLTGSDVEANPLTFSVVVAPAHGALSGTAPNLTYTPAANYNGPDSFTFKANDGQANSAPAVVAITVNAVNDTPVANPQSVTTTQDTAKAITLTGSDVEGSALIYSVMTGPAHGALTGTAPNLTYTPAAGYSGSDSFTFKVNDGTIDSPTATISITVNPSSTTILQANFDSSTEGLIYADDTFRGTNQPGYASGNRITSGGFSGGALRVYLGGIDNNIINNMSGGWKATISLQAAQEVTVSFRYKLTQASEYESDEYSQALFSLNGVLVGTSPNNYITQIAGDGNGGSTRTTNWALFEVNLGTLPAGSHLLTFGGFNNKKTYTDEWTEVLIDDLLIVARPPSATLLQANFDSNSEGFTYADDTFRVTNQPGYASGAYISSGAYSGGGLKV